MSYPVVPLKVGIEKPFRALHIADTHLLFADGRDNPDKYRIAMRRYGEYVYTNIGRNMPYFLDALQYAKDHCDILLHTGDLIDFVSLQNLEVAQKLLDLSGIDYFMCAGNHEYTNYSGQHPETPEEAAAGRELVPKYFRNNLYFDSRIVNGLNFVAVDNGEYQFSADQLEKLKTEVGKGYPIVLLIHNPLFTPGLVRIREEEQTETQQGMAACPEDARIEYRRFNPVAPDADTEAFLAFLRNTPSVKAVLAGHLHYHKNHDDLLWGETRQYVVGGGYYGCGEVFDFS